MLERFKKNSENSPSKSELEQRNKLLIHKNAELVKTIEELRLKISEVERYYVDLSNEILAKLNKSHKIVETGDDLAAEEVNQSATYLDPLTSRIVALDENEELKEINEITSKYYPVPIEEDNKNVIIRYLRHDKTLGKMVRNTMPWKQRLTINGERYYLMIQSHKIERVWEIKLMRYFQGSMPPMYSLKAITDRGEEFDSNQVIANGDTQNISLFIKLELGEGLKFEIYPEPEDYVASRVFWFY